MGNNTEQKRGNYKALLILLGIVVVFAISYGIVKEIKSWDKAAHVNENRIRSDSFNEANDSIQKAIIKSRKEMPSSRQRTYDSVQIILRKKNTSVCDVWANISRIETECIRKADKLYPDFSVEHLEYAEKLQKEAISKFRKKLGLSKDLYLLVLALGTQECV